MFHKSIKYRSTRLQLYSSSEEVDEVAVEPMEWATAAFGSPGPYTSYAFIYGLICKVNVDLETFLPRGCEL